MKKYWEKINNNKAALQEKDITKEQKSLTTSRRDFLKYFGFTIASAGIIESCQKPIEKAIPYLIKPNDITPGKANYYASSYFDGHDYASILVKTRDGRPIKIEGNEKSPITQGATNSRIQASVLNLYDDTRLKHPTIDKQKTDWETINKEITQHLKRNRNTTIVTPNVISPSTRQVIKQFQRKYPRTQWIQYDPISHAAILLANQSTFKMKAVPNYRIDKANIIVSFQADFLGTYLSPVEFSKQYSKRRKPDQKTMLKHIQYETSLSLTGSNADERYPIKPSEENIILIELKKIIEQKLKYGRNVNTDYDNIEELADKLIENKKKSIVISSTNDYNTQILVNHINYLLEAYGNTIDWDNPLYSKQAMDKAMKILVAQMRGGEVQNLILWNVNPVYSYPQNESFVQALQKVTNTIAINTHQNETTQLAKYNCPAHHYLEAWGDAQPKKHNFSLQQPAIAPIFKSQQAEQMLLDWLQIKTTYYSYVRKYWQTNLYPQQKKYSNFEIFWNNTLQQGVFNTELSFTNVNYSSKHIETAISNITKQHIPKNETEIRLYETIAIGNGDYANNPWLQELPDPITKVCWDNYISISPQYAKQYKLENGEILSINGISLPIYIQTGQANETLSIAFGYGRTVAGKTGNNVGKNVYSLVKSMKDVNGHTFSTSDIETTGEKQLLATTQDQKSMEGRAIIRETTHKEYLQNPTSGNELHAEIEKHHTTLYEKYKFEGHHWGLSVDLNACTGCGNCITACQVENNVPVIGKEQIAKKRSMHWIRIDRYHNGTEENPETLHQPVMCQQCDNAPCENVCPVAATMHSSEGINQQIYNRCIGTRYCMNNCPYRVRKFNWFEYTKEETFPHNPSTNDQTRLVLNPDVTIRERGVAEKCTFCTQKIQDKKLQAKTENRKLKDQELQTACSQSCPADALVFGDLNDPNSKISEHFKNPRNYHLLEELHTLPTVSYLTKVRNKT